MSDPKEDAAEKLRDIEARLRQPPKGLWAQLIEQLAIRAELRAMRAKMRLPPRQ